MSDPIRVSILDGDNLFRQSARAWLETAEDIVVVSEAKRPEAMTLIRETRPDVIVLGVSASRADSLQMVEQLCELFPQIKIIVLDDDGEEQLALEAFRKGALGCLLRRTQPAEVVAAVRTVAKGKAVLSPSVAGRILDEIVKRGGSV
ncbi:MAG: response regulator transcription factor [Anaerolineae bacterium]|nr:response regulator transcription factor [Anaerolineae bacterium]